MKWVNYTTEAIFRYLAFVKLNNKTASALCKTKYTIVVMCFVTTRLGNTISSIFYRKARDGTAFMRIAVQMVVLTLRILRKLQN